MIDTFSLECLAATLAPSSTTPGIPIDVTGDIIFSTDHFQVMDLQMDFWDKGFHGHYFSLDFLFFFY